MRFRRNTHSLITPLIAAFLAAMICDQSVAAQTGGGDKLIEAATYLAQADKEEGCSLEKARDWTKRALSTAKSYRSTSRTDKDTAGNLIAKCNLRLAALDQHEKSLQNSERVIRKAVKQKRLESAQAEFDNAKPPTCDANFNKLKDEIKAGRDSAAQTVSQADSVVESNPKHALSLYTDALKIDADFPDIRDKMQHASQVEHEQLLAAQRERDEAKAEKKRAGHPGMKKAANVTLFIIVMAALVGVLVYAAEHEKQNQ
jgi:hypothetical protein